MADSNKAVTVIEKSLSPVVRKAEELVISDDSSMKSAVELLSHLNRSLDQVTEEKEKVTKPLNEALKVERGRWKPFETMCESAIALVRGKMTSYKKEQDRIAEEKAAKIANRIGEGKGKLKVETAVKKIEEIKTVGKSVASDTGSVKFKKVKKFEVMDVTMLPVEFILADVVAIRAKMREGVELPGVRYYEEDEVSNSR